MDPFSLLLVQPITNVLVLLYEGFANLGLPYALGFAIIGLTIIMRLILYPLTASQLKMSKKMQDMAPHLTALKDKHKNDPKKLQQETMQLYATHGVNPVAGCLPLIVQMVVLIGLYAALQGVAKDPQLVLTHINNLVYFDWMKLNHVWDTTFFGLPLTKKPADLLNVVGFGIILIPVLTGFLQFIQSAMMFSAPQAQPQKKSADQAPDFAQSMQTSTMYVMPIMIGYFSFTFPLALALYWNTFTIFGIIQQYKLTGLGKLPIWKEKFFPVKKK